MKRPLLLLLYLLFAGTSLQSQNLIVNAGLNISSMNIRYSEMTYSTNRHPIFSPAVMLNYEHIVNRNISLKPGIKISRHGKMVAMDLGSGFYYEEKFTINYIDLPLLVCYNFNTRSTGGYNLNINLGPYLAYGFNGLVTSDNTAYVSEERLFVGEDGIERNDFGILFLAGFGFPENQVSLTINIGLKNLAITGGDYTDFRRMSIGLNYVHFIDFGPNARKMLKKRLF